MKAMKLAVAFLGLAAVGAATGVGTPAAQAQYSGSFGPGHHAGPPVSRGPGYHGVGGPRGYSSGSPSFGGGQYGRPWGHSPSFGYAPGAGVYSGSSYFGSSYSGRGFGYSSHGGYHR